MAPHFEIESSSPTKRRPQIQITTNRSSPLPGHPDVDTTTHTLPPSSPPWLASGSREGSPPTSATGSSQSSHATSKIKFSSGRQQRSPSADSSRSPSSRDVSPVDSTHKQCAQNSSTSSSTDTEAEDQQEWEPDSPRLNPINSPRASSVPLPRTGLAEYREPEYGRHLRACKIFDPRLELNQTRRKSADSQTLGRGFPIPRYA